MPGSGNNVISLGRSSSGAATVPSSVEARSFWDAEAGFCPCRLLYLLCNCRFGCELVVRNSRKLNQKQQNLIFSLSVNTAVC